MKARACCREFGATANKIKDFAAANNIGQQLSCDWVGLLGRWATLGAGLLLRWRWTGGSSGGKKLLRTGNSKSIVGLRN